MKNCVICHNKVEKAFEKKILNKYLVSYFFCTNCGFLQTEKPYWLEEAYTDAIANADCGLVQRNINIHRRLSVLLYLLFGKGGRYVDIAGGTGLLVRMMRDIGFDFYWSDPYSRNIHARGFEFETSLNPCNSVTAFEVLEHLEDPVTFINDSLTKAKTKTFIFTTELFNSKPFIPDTWWYYTPETGQHISFFQHKTLRGISTELKLNYHSAGGFHMMTKEDISTSLFALAASRTHRIAFPFVRYSMKSKTINDHLIMLNEAVNK